MGNNQTNSKNPGAGEFGGVYIKLEKTAFTPGEILQGVAYLQLVKPYPADNIFLSVKGTEYTKWIHRQRRTRRVRRGGKMVTKVYYVNVLRQGNFTIINQSINIYDWPRGQIIPQGQYSFPFQFQVPENLPGSFFFRRGTAIAQIKYTLDCYLKAEDSKVPTLNHKLNITVRENPMKLVETKEVSISKKMTTWCCCDKGQVSIKTAFEKNAYAPSEEARIITEVDNSKCSLPLPDVVFSLNQSIRLKSGLGYTKDFYFPIRSTNLGRVEAGESWVGDKRKLATIQLPPGQEGRMRDFNGEEDVNIDPSTVITPSTHGRLITSDFTLNITAQADGCFCCDSPYSATSLPILVYSPIAEKIIDPNVPQNWSPQQMPAVNLVIVLSNNLGEEKEVPFGNNDEMVDDQMPEQPPQVQGFQNYDNSQQGFQNYNNSQQASQGYNTQQMAQGYGNQQMGQGYNNQQGFQNYGNTQTIQVAQKPY